MQEKAKQIATSPVGMSAATFAVMSCVDLAAHLGPTGIVVGVIGGVVAYRHGSDIVGYVKSKVLGHDNPAFDEEGEEPARYEEGQYERGNIAQRLLGIRGKLIPTQQEADDQETVVVPEPEDTYDEEDSYSDELMPIVVQNKPFLFSSILTDGFIPFPDRIYLASLPDGTRLYCSAKNLCHVALAGSTGNGKGVIVRLLMSQLCKVGASVLLLNPHYTHYDIEQDEDWTPFLPYLVADPMEARHYSEIERYLKHIATVLLPKRLDRYAHSQSVGNPYFIVLDELPAIVEHVKSAPTYLQAILREGRKVRIYLITASQDFLVKTIAPQGGGAVRDCYRTAFYVGGDPTTAKVLLDMPANQIPEDELGLGHVMVRNKEAAKQAVRARVPYVDNQALYRLLGPSTYSPSALYDELPDELSVEQMAPRTSLAPVMVASRSPEVEQVSMRYPAQVQHQSDNPQHFGYGSGAFTPIVPVPVQAASMIERVAVKHTPISLPPELQRTLEVYEPSWMRHRDLGRALGVSHVTAGKYLQKLRNMRLID